MLYATPLGEIVGTSREKPVKKAIDGFVCKDKDVEFFLKNKAYDFEKRDKSRTYLVFNEETVELMGYFTLSLKSLEFQDTLSKSKIKEIDGYSKEIKGVAIALIGQFGKDENLAKNISGKDVLAICMDFIFQVQILIGGRYVLIECHDIKNVVDFYRRNGFELLQVDKNDNYLHLVRRI